MTIQEQIRNLAPQLWQLRLMGHRAYIVKTTNPRRPWEQEVLLITRQPSEAIIREGTAFDVEIVA